MITDVRPPLQTNTPFVKLLQEDCSEIALLLILLLGKKEIESLLESNPLPRPLIVWREACGMRGFGDLSVGNLLQGVEAIAIGVERVHEMHRD